MYIKQQRSKNVQETETEKMDGREVKHGYQLYTKKKEDNITTEGITLGATNKNSLCSKGKAKCK